MSVDQRLRTGLRSSVTHLEPDPYAALHRVEARARRADKRTRWVTVPLAAAACVAAIAVTPVIVDRAREDENPPVTGRDSLIGTYVVDVADTPAHRRVQLAGRWVVTLKPDGEVVLDPPVGYDGSTVGTTYEVLDGQLRTDALIDLPGCQVSADTVVGSYRWEELDGGIMFRVVSDACQARIDLLTDQPWQRQ
jgi:hypothetical protein